MKQMNIFEIIEQPYKIPSNKKIRLIELFGGIGAQAKALENLGVDFEHYRLVEFDKYCIKSYNAIHHTNFSASDITKIKGEDLGICDVDQYEYIMTYSFPCQDLSLAGKGRGMEKGSGTRSGLLWEVERLLREVSELPQILLMENVPQVHSKKNIGDFKTWISFLESLGYGCFYADLNAKDYGVPQNRNRTFMISVLGGYSYIFPAKQELKMRMRDFLEDEVDEKYFLSAKMKEYIVANNEHWTGNNDKSLVNKTIASCINTGEGSRRCDASNYVIPSLLSLGELDIKSQVIKVPLKRGYSANVKEEKNDTTEIDVIGNYSKSNYQATAIVGKNGVAPTVRENHGQVTGVVVKNQTFFDDLRIRKLTPLECFRLMGFNDEDVAECKRVGISDSQLYKQAGNSIVVDVLMAIFVQLLR
jgi:DNA (cytosine-5)-methyltransferase 1